MGRPSIDVSKSIGNLMPSSARSQKRRHCPVFPGVGCLRRLAACGVNGHSEVFQVLAVGFRVVADAAFALPLLCLVLRVKFRRQPAGPAARNEPQGPSQHGTRVDSRYSVASDERTP
jgi:hypothetical protein